MRHRRPRHDYSRRGASGLEHLDPLPEHVKLEETPAQLVTEVLEIRDSLGELLGASSVPAEPAPLLVELRRPLGIKLELDYGVMG